MLRDLGMERVFGFIKVINNNKGAYIMKNKKLLFVVGISLVVSLLLTGCIGEDPEQKARDKVEELFTA
ncbi:MAG: hypothetical protein ACOC1K_04795 [Nanoarchaeota archaeon]